MMLKKNHPLIYERGINYDVFITNTNIAGDWRKELKGYLEDPSKRTPHRIRIQAQNFTLVDGELYRKRLDNACHFLTTWK